MSEVLRSMGSRLWRERQAGCGAVADLIQGRRWTQLKGIMGQVMKGGGVQPKGATQRGSSIKYKGEQDNGRGYNVRDLWCR